MDRKIRKLLFNSTIAVYRNTNGNDILYSLLWQPTEGMTLAQLARLSPALFFFQPNEKGIVIDFTNTEEVKFYDVEQQSTDQYRIIGDTKFSLNRGNPRLKRTFMFRGDTGQIQTQKIEIYKSELLFIGAFYLADYLYDKVETLHFLNKSNFGENWERKVRDLVAEYQKEPSYKLEEVDPSIRIARDSYMEEIRSLLDSEPDYIKAFKSDQIEKYWNGDDNADNRKYFIKSATTKDTNCLSDIFLYKQYGAYKVHFSGSFNDLKLTDDKQFSCRLLQEPISKLDRFRLSELEDALSAEGMEQAWKEYHAPKKEYHAPKKESWKLEIDSEDFWETHTEEEIEEISRKPWEVYLETGETEYLKKLGVSFDGSGELKYSKYRIPLDITWKLEARKKKGTYRSTQSREQRQEEYYRLKERYPFCDDYELESLFPWLRE